MEMMMVPMDASLLRSLSGDGTVWLCVGNTLKGDDAAGPELGRLLSAAGQRVIDAGTTPENYVGAVARMEPETVVLVDAAHLDRRPGSWELLDAGELASGGFTTHTLTPTLVMERLEDETGARVVMLAIQPASTRFGEPLSPPVMQAIEELSRLIT